MDGYQGAEAELILFSLVRGNSSGRLGFVRDLRRANVALTRARSGLLVFGARETLRQEEAVWAPWLRWLEQKGGVRAVEELEEILI